MSNTETSTPPTSITFSIEGDEYLPADPISGREAQLFGPDFAGSFTVRFPSIMDTFEIAARTTALAERFAVKSPTEMQRWAYDLGSALMFLSVLATDKPSWFRFDTDGTAKAVAAVKHAAARAQEKLEAAKKNSAGTTSSTGT